MGFPVFIEAAFATLFEGLEARCFELRDIAARWRGGVGFLTIEDMERETWAACACGTGFRPRS